MEEELEMMYGGSEEEEEEKTKDNDAELEGERKAERDGGAPGKGGANSANRDRGAAHGIVGERAAEEGDRELGMVPETASTARLGVREEQMSPDLIADSDSSLYEAPAPGDGVLISDSDADISPNQEFWEKEVEGGTCTDWERFQKR